MTTRKPEKPAPRTTTKGGAPIGRQKARGKARGRRLPDTLTPDELEALLAGCNVRCSTGARNRAMLELAAGAGLRVSELVNLRPADIDWKGNTLRVVQGKGAKDRTVAVHDTILARMQAWAEKRARLGFNGRQPFFCGLKSDGRALPVRYVQTLVRRLAERAGIERRVHPHTLRHTFATLALKGAWLFAGRPWSIREVQAQLGHSRLATTEVYTHCTVSDLVARVKPSADDPAAQLVAAVAALPADARAALMHVLGLGPVGQAGH